ncbi:hypothetical protein BDV18DRAFT_21618 [Aspergillus unguis]
MESKSGIDEEQYLREVLGLNRDEENEQQQRLAEEAKELGLKVPEVEIVASLAASIASGMVDLSSPILSSSSSTDRNSVCEITQTPDSPRLDQLATSLSEYTISSNLARAGSTRSLASLSTRPTSFSSSEGRLAPGNDSTALRTPGNRNSLLSVISGTDRKDKERRKSTIKSAIDKIPFRKRRRTPSTVLLPPAAQIRVTKGEGGVEKLYVESKSDDTRRPASPEDEEETLKLEVPVFDSDALVRSLAHPELRQMRETQTSERNSHVSFQNNLISELRRGHQIELDEKRAQDRQTEDGKREKSIEDASRMEERQLMVEMEQVREFERAKTNSKTRIKYMEGYLSSSSPPDSRSPSGSGSDLTTPSRNFTQQHKDQLAQEYRNYDSMSQLHESKIKVLRDRQEIRLQEAVARMDRELDTMIEKHAKEVAELQKEHQQEETAILEALNSKKTKLRHRWVLEEAILRKKLENQDGKPYGPLPPLSFSDTQSETRDSAICVSDADVEADSKRQQST